MGGDLWQQLDRKVVFLGMLKAMALCVVPSAVLLYPEVLEKPLTSTHISP